MFHLTLPSGNGKPFPLGCPSSFLGAPSGTVTLRSPWILLQTEHPQLSQPVSVGGEVCELAQLHSFLQLLRDSHVMGLCLSLQIFLF